MKQCPRCDGAKTHAAFVDGACGGHYEPALRCDLCKGSEEVADEVYKWLQIGKRHRFARVDRLETIGQCADRMGVTAAELSAMEHGRSDPARLLVLLP